jgi:hypothetical protein
MKEALVCQGREVCATELSWLQEWIGDHPDWSRKRLARELCVHWEWRTATGQIKDFAARTFLLKLDQQGIVSLPPVRESMRRHRLPSAPKAVEQIVVPSPVSEGLGRLTPISLVLAVPGSHEDRLFGHYLSCHHYLSFRCTVGENLKYLVRDRFGRDLACVLFGSAAWKTAPRDEFVGWNDIVRRRNLNLITNNTRFLILPWVTVPHLASHVLAKITRRLPFDWQQKYGHPVHLVETFVERDLFRGTCYRAANWHCVGHTSGRSRQDRHHNLGVPVKDIFLYPLISKFREVLCHVDP